MFFYAMLRSPLWVLPIELVSGFTFSMCYVIIASYSSFITIPGTESTVQSLFGAMFDGLGSCHVTDTKNIVRIRFIT